MSTDALAGKVAAVTGAAMGMGAATAELLAARGAAVLVADRDQRAGESTVDKIVAGGGRASFLRVDVGDSDQVRAMVDTAAKHGVIGLTKAASLENAAHGIRVNAVCPGAIDTPMIRYSMDSTGRREQDLAPRLSLFGRFGRPEEVAEASLWLCSDRSSFVTGHALAADGGYLSS